MSTKPYSMTAVVVGMAVLVATSTAFVHPRHVTSSRNAIPSTRGMLNTDKTKRSSLLVGALKDPQQSASETGSATGMTMIPPDMEAYSSAFATVYEELPSKECTATVGEIPDDLIGTYYRSGPAMFTAGSILPPKQSIVQPKTKPVPDGSDLDRMVTHPFEGDGAILGVTFSKISDSEGDNDNNNNSSDGPTTCTARFRFVRTAGFTNERKKGKKLYSAMETTRELGPTAAVGLGNDLSLPLYRHHLQPGLNKLRKNTSNTRAFYWGKRLITLWEGGLPYKLDGLALSTEGRSQLGGILKEQDPFGCKGVIDSKSNRALFYSNVQNPKSSDITLYEFNSNFRLVEEQGGKVETQFPGFAMISDFAATTNYAVFVQPSAVANGMQYMFNKEPGKVVSVENGGPSTVHLVSRVGSTKPSRSFTIPFDGVVDAELQFINAYEDETSGLVIFDAIRSDGSSASSGQPSKWPWASSLAEYTSATPKKSLWRYTLDTKSGSVQKQMISDAQASFGTVNPAVSAQKHRYIYAAVGSMGSEVAPPQGISRFDTETMETQTWIPKEYEFCGEPMFANRQGSSGEEEDDGYILSVLYNGQSKESEMIILRANNISAGPIARVPMGISIPHGLFGCFTDSEEARWQPDVIDRRARLADKMESKGNMWNEVKSDFSGLGLRLDDIEEIFPDWG